MKIFGKKSFGRDLAITTGLLAGIGTLSAINSGFYEKDELATDYSNTAPSIATEISAKGDRVSYVQTVFPQISSWDTEEIRPLLAEPTRSSLPKKDLVEVVATLENKLGSLESYTLPIESQSVSITADSMLVTYKFSALFSKGQADVTLQLLDKDGNIGLLAFNITLAEGVEQLS